MTDVPKFNLFSILIPCRSFIYRAYWESENVLYIEGHGISRYDVQCTIDCLDEHGRYLGEGNDARYITVFKSRYTVCISK